MAFSQKLSKICHLFTAPPIFGYRLPKNFSNILCRAKIKYPPSDGRPALDLYTNPVTELTARLRSNLKETPRHFRSTVTHQKFRKNNSLHVVCQTDNVVYFWSPVKTATFSMLVRPRENSLYILKNTIEMLTVKGTLPWHTISGLTTITSSVPASKF